MLHRIFTSKAVEYHNCIVMWCNVFTSSLHSPFPCNVCAVMSSSLHVCEDWRGKAVEVRYRPLYCMLRWSWITSWQMVCRLITCSTRPIARDETVLTVSNALPRGPYHPPLLACVSPLFLLSRCYLSGDLCRNVLLVDLPVPLHPFCRVASLS